MVNLQPIEDNADSPTEIFIPPTFGGRHLTLADRPKPIPAPVMPDSEAADFAVFLKDFISGLKEHETHVLALQIAFKQSSRWPFQMNAAGLNAFVTLAEESYLGLNKFLKNSGIFTPGFAEKLSAFEGPDLSSPWAKEIFRLVNGGREGGSTLGFKLIFMKHFLEFATGDYNSIQSHKEVNVYLGNPYADKRTMKKFLGSLARACTL